ncbi:MAG: PilZ domain-containing protein [Leptospiraceae bacterium]|nr:PilZ domain-containing protein [Leptospiraceae bacterium]
MEKELTDPESINKVVNSLFGIVPVSILTDHGEFPIKIIALRPQGLVVRSPKIAFNTRERKLSIVHNNHLIIGEFLFVGGDEVSGVEVLKPYRMIIGPAVRRNERISLPDGSIDSVFVTNIINQSDVLKALKFDDKNMESILQTNLVKLKKTFGNGYIYLSDKMDNRLRLMMSFDRPIFIPDRNDKDSIPNDMIPYEEYLQILKIAKLQDKFISEITIPMKYKGYVPLGYIQVFGENCLDTKSFNEINILATSVKKEIIQTGIFQESKEICEVSDLNSHGISFLHSPTRMMNRSFTNGATVIFDLQFSQNMRNSYRAVIKNIKSTEKLFRLGCEFYPSRVDEMKSLESYLASKSPQTETEPAEENEQD